MVRRSQHDWLSIRDTDERRRIHCFENVQVLLFVVAISEYDQRLYEDEEVGRLEEALQLFQSLTTSKWFDHTSMVLMLNKLDLFRDKLSTSPLIHYEPDFTGGTDLALGTAFMIRKFKKVYRTGSAAVNVDSRSGRQLYTHATCATDTAQARVVIAAILDTIISNTLAEVGLM